MILLEAELLELKANGQRKASGAVVEAHVSHGKGPMATVIVQNGTLKEGDIVVVGVHVGKIRAMFDDHQKSIQEAGPSTAIEILGLSGVPEAGDSFYVVESERLAREIALKRQEQAKSKKLQGSSRITLEDLYAQIQEGKIKELNCVVKADVQGSLEAIVDSLKKIPQQAEQEVGLNFIHTGVGDINASDVLLADASNAIVIGFQVEMDTRAKQELEPHPVDVRTYRIIYDAVNDVKKALEGLLEPKTRKKFVARVEIRQVFKLSKTGVVAGCFVQKGKIHRKVQVDVLRNGQVVFSGTLSSLKRFKDDVREVAEGFECGLTLSGFDQIELGDVIEAYELERIPRTL
jgi:translation initiation factor IF-2